MSNPREKPLVICVDFDGTLCEQAWPNIGPPKSMVITAVKSLIDSGWQAVLHTCRTGKQLEQAIAWCKEHGLEFAAINENTPDRTAYWGGDKADHSPKPSAEIYLDDLAMTPDMFVEQFGRKTIAGEGSCKF